MTRMVVPVPTLAPQTMAADLNYPDLIQWRAALYALYPDLPLPKYFLASEIRQLAALPLNQHHRMLMLTLFNTGARINELLDVTPDRIQSTPLALTTAHGIETYTLNSIKLRTLKQQRRGKPGTGSKDSFRLVKLYDPEFVRDLKSYIVTHGKNDRLPLFRNHEKSHDVRINPETGRRRRNDKALSDQTARNWLSSIEDVARANGLVLPIALTPRSLRHSCAIHLMLNGLSEKQIALHLGHKSLKSTRVYTDLLSMDALTVRPIAF